MRKLKRFFVVACICVICLLGIAVTANAQKEDYMTKETVEKSGMSTVYSNSTGTNIWSVNYGATCTSGTLTIMVQGYDGGWVDLPLTIHTLNAGESDSWIYSDQSYNYKIYRLQLSGISGRGNGYVQGR